MPVDDTDEARMRFRPIVDKIVANDGLGYRVHRHPQRRKQPGL